MMNRKNMSWKINLTVVLFAFSDILGGANLHLVYFWGVYLIAMYLWRKRYFYWGIIRWSTPLLVMIVCSYTFSDIKILPIKTVVYFLKLVLCFSLMTYIEEEAYCFDMKTFYNKFSDVLIVLFFCSLIFRDNEFFWRLNDPFNSISKTRLQLLFKEPSTLSAVLGVLLVMSYYSLLYAPASKKKTVKVVLLGISIILSFSMSGLAYTAVCIVFLAIGYIPAAVDKKHVNTVWVLSIVGIITVGLFLIYVPNPISKRLVIMLSGADPSFDYRWTSSIAGMKGVLQDTNYFGLGMGNMNTPIGIAYLQKNGSHGRFSNSFLYFIAENGVLGFAYIIMLLTYCVRKMIQNRRANPSDPTILKMAFFVFVVISQIAGEYFTDPLIWCMYGLICAKNVNREHFYVMTPN